MGFALALGVVAFAERRRQARLMGWRVIDLAVLAASVLLPIGMSVWPGADGVLQRAMFALAYGWYAVEAVAVRRGSQRFLAEQGYAYEIVDATDL